MFSVFSTALAMSTLDSITKISLNSPGTALRSQLHYFPMKPCRINVVGVSFSLRRSILFHKTAWTPKTESASTQKALLVDEVVLLQLKLLNDGAENEQRGLRPWLFPPPSPLFECSLSSFCLSTIENKEKSEQKAESFISCLPGRVEQSFSPPFFMI